MLNAAGASLSSYIYYFDFGREMWRLTNRINGPAALVEAKILRDKWAARGLSAELLGKISYDVFSIRLPAAP
ncbi:MAG: hypothetical protein R6X14_03850 [bacterium]